MKALIFLTLRKKHEIWAEAKTQRKNAERICKIFNKNMNITFIKIYQRLYVRDNATHYRKLNLHRLIWIPKWSDFIRP